LLDDHPPSGHPFRADSQVDADDCREQFGDQPDCQSYGEEKRINDRARQVDADAEDGHHQREGHLGE